MIYRAASGVWRIGQPGLATRAVVSTGNWWDGDGAIDGVNVLEHVESPTIGQAYAGSAVSSGNAWTLAARTDSIVSATNSGGKLIFGGASDLPDLGMNGTNRGVFSGGASWSQTDCFTDTANHVYFAVCNGTNIQVYRDNVAIGSPWTPVCGIGQATSRWRSNFASAAQWPNAVQCGAVYNIALNSSQRAALYAEMAAL